MTELKRPITREVPTVQISGRPLVVTLVPPNMLQLRPKGMRHAFTIALEACLWSAAKVEADNRATLDALKPTRRRSRRKGK